jgi:hypothetical protein
MLSNAKHLGFEVFEAEILRLCLRMTPRAHSTRLGLVKRLERVEQRIRPLLQMIADKDFGNLHGVERRSLAQVIGNHPEV